VRSPPGGSARPSSDPERRCGGGVHERGDFAAGHGAPFEQGVGQDADASTLLPHQRPRPLPEPIEVAPAPGEPQPPNHLLSLVHFYADFLL
jgi:hypothetical protein